MKVFQPGWRLSGGLVAGLRGPGFGPADRLAGAAGMSAPPGRGGATVAHRDHRLSRWLIRVLSRLSASESQIGFPKVFLRPA